MDAVSIWVDMETANKSPQRDHVSRGEQSTKGQTLENPMWKWWWRKRNLKARLRKIIIKEVEVEARKRGVTKSQREPRVSRSSKWLSNTRKNT